MSAAKAIIKTVTIGLSIVSFVAVAETYYDKKFYTAKFMDKVEAVSINIKPSVEKRVVASKESNLPLIHSVEMKSSELIDGEWMITRVSQFSEEKEEVIFDKYNKEEDRNAKVVVDFKLIDKSTVKINNDDDQIYSTSLLTENGTIALFKEFGEGYEVIEAIKFKSKKKEVNVRTVESEKKSRFSISEGLFIVSSVVTKNKEKKLLTASKVTGNAYLSNGELILMGIYLKDESLGIDIGPVNLEVDIKSHGTFDDDNTNQGIVTVSSKKEIKVRFSNGILAGSLLTFATYERKIEIEDQYHENEKQVKDAIENDDAQSRVEIGGGLQEAPEELYGNNDEIDDQYEKHEEEHLQESDIDNVGYNDEESYDDGNSKIEDVGFKF